MEFSDNIVRETLAQDSASRFKGIQGKLVKLDELSSKEWTKDMYHLPARKLKLNYSSTEVKEQLLKEFPALKHLDWNKFTVAGGAVCAKILGHGKSRDVDIFMHHVDSDTEAMKLISAQINSIILANKREQFTIERSFRCVTLSIGSRLDIDTYQFILRRYTSISEVIHSFDIGASAVAFDGQSVWLTNLARFAYEYGYNIVDPSRRSPSYEYRFNKYYEKGFGLIFPKLKIEKVAKFTLFTLFKSNEFELAMRHYYHVYEEISDYLREEYHYVHGLKYVAPQEFVKHLSNCYQLIQSEDHECRAENVSCDPNEIWSCSVITEAHLQKYFAKLYNKLQTEQLPMAKLIKMKEFSLEELCREVGRMNLNGAKNVLDKNLNLYLRRLKEIKENDEKPIIGEVPSDQHMLGSFHPTPCTEEEWYCEYYAN